eukprot:16434192-Heterocapsa_arctica.AAC.1
MEEDEERPGAQRRKAEEVEEGKTARRRLKEKTGAEKRPRDKQMIEEQEMEEVLARGELAQRAIDAVASDETVWYDEYTGKELDPVKVKAAMDKELSSFA